MKDMCAECGADLREVDKSNQSAAVAMVHNIPELMVSMKVKPNSQFVSFLCGWMDGW